MSKQFTQPSSGRPTTRAKPGGGGARQGATSPRLDPKREAEARAVARDILAFAIEIAGIREPKPAADAEGMLLLLSCGEWFDSLMSGASLFPYIGDLAKTGRLPHYVKSVQKAVDAANADETFAVKLLPGFRKLYQALILLPAAADKHIDLIRSAVLAFLRFRGMAKVPSNLPDISRHFQFRTYTRGENEYHEATGWLGIPGKVQEHRNIGMQRAISAGSGDDAGHLIGNRFGPPGDDKNLGPQNWKANRYGSYCDLEKDWTRKLEQGNGIHAKVTDVYKAGEIRPFYRKVEWMEVDVTGQPTTYDLDFMNPHTLESRAKQGIEPTVDKPQTDNVICVDFQNRRRQ